MENPIVTTVTTAVTENGIDTFFYDVSQSNANQATWWNSVSNYCNNIIDSIKACAAYISYITDIAAVFISENTFPICLSFALTCSIFFLWFDFVRGR